MVLFAGWIQFFVSAVLIVAPVLFPQLSGFTSTTPQTFRDFLNRQQFFVFIITIVLGGLIADDRRANALQLYLSKPLTRVEYILGKAAPLLILILGVTLVPALCLLLLQIVFSGSFSFLANNLFVLPAITLASLVRALLSTFMTSVRMEDGSTVHASAYFYNAPLGRAERIASGDYLEYLRVR